MDIFSKFKEITDISLFMFWMCRDRKNAKGTIIKYMFGKMTGEEKNILIIDI